MPRLHGDHWEGVLNLEWHVEQPTEHDVIAALGRLDAAKFTMITIHRDGDHHLAIGGGAGKYVVYVSPDNDRFWNLLSHQRTDSDTVVLTAGGQAGEYPGSHVVDRDQAQSAAIAFLEQGQLDPRQRWEEQE